jgi:hypothetical protein
MPLATAPYVALISPTPYVVVMQQGNEMPEFGMLPFVSPAQKQTISVDFGAFLPGGVTLTGSPTVTATVNSGTDSTPQSRISGGSVGTESLANGGSGVANTAISFQVSGTLPGVVYIIEVVCTRSDGDIVEAWGYLPSEAPGEPGGPRRFIN